MFSRVGAALGATAASYYKRIEMRCTALSHNVYSPSQSERAKSLSDSKKVTHDLSTRALHFIIKKYFA